MLLLQKYFTPARKWTNFKKYICRLGFLDQMNDINDGIGNIFNSDRFGIVVWIESTRA